MKYVAIAALLLCGLTAACSIRSERTVVERPVAPSTAAVIVDTPPPATTVYVPD
jgi:hypothetical protein